MIFKVNQGENMNISRGAYKILFFSAYEYT
jgi:hypothetical protein